MRYWTLITAVALTRCSSPTTNPPPATGGAAPETVRRPEPAKVFADYLQATFHHSIPRAGEHWYVVIPAVGCLGCAHAELRYLAIRPWSAKVTVVSSGLLRDLSAAERKSLARHTHLLADTVRVADNTLDRLNLPFVTLTGVVHTRDGQVIAFMPFDKDSYRKVFATLPQGLP